MHIVTWGLIIMEDNLIAHNLMLENRNTLELTGVKNVDAYNDEEIVVNFDFGNLLIKGNDLSIETLDLSTGLLNVTGKILALIYDEKIETKSFLKRLFT